LLFLLRTSLYTHFPSLKRQMWNARYYTLFFTNNGLRSI
jgi:hypothetical protein